MGSDNSVEQYSCFPVYYACEASSTLQYGAEIMNFFSISKLSANYGFETWGTLTSLYELSNVTCTYNLDAIYKS